MEEEMGRAAGGAAGEGDGEDICEARLGLCEREELERRGKEQWVGGHTGEARSMEPELKATPCLL